MPTVAHTCIAEILTILGVATASTLRRGVDPDIALDRLLWLEAQGLTITRKARQLRHRVPRTPLVDEPELVREIARLSIVARSREDELAIWREHLTPTPVRVPIPPREQEPPRARPWWARWFSL